MGGILIHNLTNIEPTLKNRAVEQFPKMEIVERMKEIEQILLTQTHIIRKYHRLYKYCDDMCFRSKNLYNRANYLLREEFINNGEIIFSNELNKQMKNEDCFKALPAKTSQQIIILLGKNWKSFFKSVKDWKNNKSKYCGMPKLPKYKSKNGRNIVLFVSIYSRFCLSLFGK